VERSIMKSPVLRAVAIIVIFAGVMAFVFWPRGLPAPREENRTMHAAGYSIILPPQWDARADADPKDGYAKDRLLLRPVQVGHWQPEISVARLRKSPDAAALKANEHFRDGRFGDVEALVFDQPIKKYWVYKVIFPRGGEWFELSVSTPDFEDVEHSTWNAYLRSFRYPDPKSPVVQARPSTESSPTTFHIDLSK
jgi:hypothetical protein